MPHCLHCAKTEKWCFSKKHDNSAKIGLKTLCMQTFLRIFAANHKNYDNRNEHAKDEAEADFHEQT